MWSVQANLVAAPALGPATVLGVLATLVAPWWPAAATALGWSAGLFTGWIAGVAQTFAGLPGARLPWPGGVGGLVLLAVVTVVVLLLVGRSRALRTAGERRGSAVPRRRRCVSGSRGRCGWGRAGAARAGRSVVHDRTSAPERSRRPCCWSSCWGSSVCSCDPSSWGAVRCRRTGRSWRATSGRVTRWCCAPARAPRWWWTSAPGDAADRCLDELGVQRVDLLVLTHFHADHVGGLDAVLRGRTVARALVTGTADPPAQADRTLGALETAGVPVQVAVAGDAGTQGGARWEVLQAGPGDEGAGEGCRRAARGPTRATAARTTRASRSSHGCRESTSSRSATSRTPGRARSRGPSRRAGWARWTW
ncbi:ComEC/Rec2 family competence protein [Cellulosimicrobium sp. Marseille-Q8652]